MTLRKEHVDEKTICVLFHNTVAKTGLHDTIVEKDF